MLYSLVVLLVLAQTPDDPPSAADAYIHKVIKVLPAWEQDTLAQYEQPELEVVRNDIKAASGDILEDDLLLDAEQLDRDWDALEAVDEALKTRDVI